MSITDKIRGEYEIKSVIEEMYYCRLDELILETSTKNEITLQELEKLPEVIAKQVFKNNEETKEETSEIDDETEKENLNKRFYTTGFKDGVNMILESLN